MQYLVTVRRDGEAYTASVAHLADTARYPPQGKAIHGAAADNATAAVLSAFVALRLPTIPAPVRSDAR